MKLKTLGITTAVLFVCSLMVYFYENSRSTGLISGSDYIKGLDIANIHKIILVPGKNEEISFVRDRDKFLISSHKSYPASNVKINDLIYKIASIQIKEKITKNPSEEDVKKYQLDKENKSYQIRIFDNNKKETVSFFVGKSHKEKGNYLYKKADGGIYLSNAPISFSSSYKDFIDKDLLTLKTKEIEKIHFVSDKKVELVKKDDKYQMVTPKSRFKEDKVENYFKNFNSLKFKEYFKHDETEVSALAFKKDIKVQLKNKLIYKLGLATKNKKYFIKINALVDDLPRQIVLKGKENKEELQQIEAMMNVQGAAQKINLEKGSWVYLVDKDIYEKLVKNYRDFL